MTDSYAVLTNIGPGFIQIDSRGDAYISIDRHKPIRVKILGATHYSRLKNNPRQPSYIGLVGLPQAWGNVNVTQCEELTLAELSKKLTSK
jgi:hypothetical protein